MAKFEEYVQTFLVILGAIILFGIAYILFIITPKLLGIVMIAAGILIMIYFPYISDYQPKIFTKAMIRISMVLIIIGIILLIFG